MKEVNLFGMPPHIKNSLYYNTDKSIDSVISEQFKSLSDLLINTAHILLSLDEVEATKIIKNLKEGLQD